MRRVVLISLIIITSLTLLSLLMLSYLSRVKRNKGYSWDFEKSIEGWSLVHNLKLLSVSNSSLMIEVVGFDPYMHSPPINVKASEVRLLKVRVAVTEGAMLKVYWIRLDDPNWDEKKSYTFLIIPDGEFHEYSIDLGIHPEWKGIIIQFRIDLEPPNTVGAKIFFDYIALLELSMNFKISLSTDTALPIDNVEFSLRARLVNRGKTVSDVKVILKINDRVVEEKVFPEIKSSEELALSHTLKLKEGLHRIEVSISSRGRMISLYRDEILVSRKDILKRRAEDLALNAGPFEIRIAKGALGYTTMLIYTKSGKLLGVIHPLSKVTYLTNGLSSRSLVPKSAKIKPNAIELSGSTDGLSFKIEILKVVDGMIKVNYTLTATRGKWYLAQFRGPWIYLGEKSFGSNKSAALLPGLEWLEGNESSSNTLDVKPPYSLRLVPHPLKLTVTAVGLEVEGYLISILWRPTYPQPSLIFASPNWFESQENHLVGLFLPYVPNNVKENEIFASSPYELAENGSISISALIAVIPRGEVVDLVPLWIRVFGLPQVETPRSFEDEVTLCREGYMNIWDSNSKGWAHAIGGSPTLAISKPYPKDAFLLLIDYYLTNSNVALEMAREALSKLIKEEGVNSLSSLAGAHIPENPLPLILGRLPEGLGSLRGTAYHFINKMREDGTWGYHKSMSMGSRELGKEGETEVGLNALPAAIILRYARMSGDEKALRAGLRALEVMSRFKVPRAAQVWEIPVHTPDLLAAARAIDAYLEGYILTGNKSYLERAIYWAKAGLPFIYLWFDGKREVMAYSTIPVFGATFYVHPWFGRAVQWNGLVYAYELLRLSQYDNSLPWRRIALGILSSAMKQQATEGKYKGLYPDCWDIITNSPYPPWINPEDILRSLYLASGIRIDLDTRILEIEGQRIHVLSTSTIDEVRFENSTLILRTEKYPLPYTFVTVVGIPKPKSVLVEGEEIFEVEDLSSLSEGWKYCNGFLIIKFISNKRIIEIRL